MLPARTLRADSSRIPITGGLDVLQLQLYTSVHLPGEEVERLLGLMDERGCWRDIDYTDQTRGRWQPTLHLTRLQALAKLWATPVRIWPRSAVVPSLARGNRLLAASRSPLPQLVAQRNRRSEKLATVLLMLGDEASPDEVAEECAFWIVRLSVVPDRTGMAGGQQPHEGAADR